MTGRAGPARAIWIVQQHDRFEIVEAEDVPSTEVEVGERMKAAFGPYSTRADAEQVKRNMESKTLRGKQEGRR